MAAEGKTSRLAQIQMRFQQKQQHEINLKRSEMSLSRNLETLDINDNAKLTATLGAGKVRQMFDERRQRTTGIDKSYPLQPISSRKSPLPPASNMIKSHSTLSDGKSLTHGTKLQRLPASADGNFNTDKLNGNHVVLSNKQNGLNGSLDNETFPDFFDDDSTMIGKKVPVKLPNVGKPISNFNKSNSTMKLKPVMGKSPVPAADLSAKKPASVKKLTPVPMKPVANTSQQSLTKSVKPVIGATPKPVKDGSDSVRSSANSNSSQRVVQRPSTPPENMAACSNCSRFFNEDRIEKHESICKKAKKRKVFDATKHRVQGTEAEVYVKKALKVSPKKQAPAATANSAKSNWRKKHEEFIAAIRSAKKVKAHLAAGGKLSDLPPPPPSENPDYVQCPHCSRRFNQAAAERHIPKCANFQHNKPKPVPKKRF